MLSAAEVAGKDERGIHMGMTTAKFPFEPNAAHLFFQLSSRRHERGSMLVAKNRTGSRLSGVFGNAVATTAILDRLLHHGHVIAIRADSYRLRARRRTAWLTKLAQTPLPSPISRKPGSQF